MTVTKGLLAVGPTPGYTHGLVLDFPRLAGGVADRPSRSAHGLASPWGSGGLLGNHCLLMELTAIHPPFSPPPDLGYGKMVMIEKGVDTGKSPEGVICPLMMTWLWSQPTALWVGHGPHVETT